MSKFEYPIQRSDVPTSASIEPKLSQRERNEHEGIQIDTVSGIGSAACDSVSCHLCEYYLRDAQPEVLDTGETPVNAFDRTDVMTHAATATGFSWDVRGILQVFRSAARTAVSTVSSSFETKSKENYDDESTYVISATSAAGDQTIEIEIDSQLYEGLKGSSLKKREERLASQIKHYKILLSNLRKYEREEIDSGKEKNNRRAMINLQFQVLDTIQQLTDELTEVRFGGSRFTIGSARSSSLEA